MISSVILAVEPEERAEMAQWLVMPNEIILKSERYENLINDVCMYYYKESVNNINEDTHAFVRRSANELLRNKASKEALRKKLMQASQTEPVTIVDASMHDAAPLPVASAEMINHQQYPQEVNTVDPSQLQYMIATQVDQRMINVG